jgi:uncharacterized membrane protein
VTRPWADRPSLVAWVLTLTGLGVAGYLTYVHYEGIAPVCTSGGCERVQASSYAEIGGIPVALLGLAGWVMIGISLWINGDVGRVLTFTLALIGFGFSIYLTYLEISVIDAICQWCLANAILMSGVFVASIVRLTRLEGPDRPAPV